MSDYALVTSDDDIFVPTGADWEIDGDFNVITVDDNATLAVVGHDNTIDAGDDTLLIDDNGGPANYVNGSYNDITVTANSLLTVNGTGNVIHDDGHGYLTLDGDPGSSAYVEGTVLELTTPDYFTLNFVGTQNNLHFGDHSSAVVTGDDDNLFASNCWFSLSGCVGGGDEIVGDNNRVVLTGDKAQLLLYGDYEVVRAGAGTSIAVMSGSDDRFVGAGFDVVTTGATRVWIGGNGVNGAYDTLTGSNLTAVVGANSNVVISGDDDVVAVRAGAQLYFVGAGLNAHLGVNASLAITGKGDATDRVTGADCDVNVASAANVRLVTRAANVTIGDNVTLTVLRSYNVITANTADTINVAGGFANQITLGVDDAITDNGASTRFYVDNYVGATTIANFGADDGALVGFLNGVGGFSSAQDAFNHLQGDGAGGSYLSLGGGGSIDFLGVTNLTAANFSIGKA